MCHLYQNSCSVLCIYLVCRCICFTECLCFPALHTDIPHQSRISLLLLFSCHSGSWCCVYCCCCFDVGRWEQNIKNILRIMIIIFRYRVPFSTADGHHKGLCTNMQTSSNVHNYKSWVFDTSYNVTIIYIYTNVNKGKPAHTVDRPKMHVTKSFIIHNHIH